MSDVKARGYVDTHTLDKCALTAIYPRAFAFMARETIEMPWVKLDDGFPFHRKAILAGKDGRALYISALCWTSGQLTDGFIDAAAVPMLAAISDVANYEANAKQLVEVGLWEEVDDGYLIHDYHDYNPSSEKVKAIRNARSKAGRKGGLASGSKREANTQANAEAKVEQKRTPSPSPLTTKDKGANTAPMNFEDWLIALKTPSSIGEKNGVAVLVRMGQSLYEHFPTDNAVYGHVGKLARKTGSQSKFARILWDNASKPLAVPLDYLTSVVYGNAEREGPAPRRQKQVS